MAALRTACRTTHPGSGADFASGHSAGSGRGDGSDLVDQRMPRDRVERTTDSYPDSGGRGSVAIACVQGSVEWGGMEFWTRKALVAMGHEPGSLRLSSFEHVDRG